METAKKTTRKKLYYIGFRGNPQLKNGGYYKKLGQLSKKDAREKETHVSYGTFNIVFSTDSEEAYNAEIARLTAEFGRVA